MGRKKKELSEEQITQFKALACFLSLDQIADYFEMTRKTLERIRHDDESINTLYKSSKQRGNANVGKALLTSALSGNTTAQIFYLKTQAGWRETMEVINKESDITEDNQLEENSPVLKSLRRTIYAKGGETIDIEFAIHLYSCARDLLPFDKALIIYGFVPDDFPAEKLLRAQKCYNIGNAHIIRELTGRMRRESNLDNQARIDNLLDRVAKLYVKEEEKQEVNVTITTKEADPSTYSPQDEEQGVIVDNDVPEAK